MFHKGVTCSHLAYRNRAPADIVHTLVDIEGKDLVMKTDDDYGDTDALLQGATYKHIKRAIDVDGKDPVMAKNECGGTAFHEMCYYKGLH